MGSVAIIEPILGVNIPPVFVIILASKLKKSTYPLKVLSPVMVCGGPLKETKAPLST